jgi:hypothetical protein
VVSAAPPQLEPASRAFLECSAHIYHATLTVDIPTASEVLHGVLLPLLKESLVEAGEEQEEVRTLQHYCVLLCTTVYYCVLLCTTVYYCVLLCTTVYYCEQL